MKKEEILKIINEKNEEELIDICDKLEVKVYEEPIDMLLVRDIFEILYDLDNLDKEKLTDVFETRSTFQFFLDSIRNILSSDDTWYERIEFAVKKTIRGGEMMKENNFVTYDVIEELIEELRESYTENPYETIIINQFESMSYSELLDDFIDDLNDKGINNKKDLMNEIEIMIDDLVEYNMWQDLDNSIEEAIYNLTGEK